jgi:hypothetical protein
VDHTVIEVLVSAILRADAGDVDRGVRPGTNCAHIYLFIIKEIVKRAVKEKGKREGEEGYFVGLPILSSILAVFRSDSEDSLSDWRFILNCYGVINYVTSMEGGGKGTK